jgi:CBS domain-containing protein
MPTIEDILMAKGPDVVVAAPQNTAYEAARMMAEANVGSVMIKTGDDLQGIFTERDLLRRVVAKGKDPAATPLAEVMTSPVKTCHLDENVHDVADRLEAEHIRHMAVVAEDALIGMVSLRDVLRISLVA